MTEQTDFYRSTYSNLKEQALLEVRREIYGEDIGQNSWLTAEEYDVFCGWLTLSAKAHVLEVACGSGGPALHLARKHGCHVTGIDISEDGVATARQTVIDAQMTDVDFQWADANERLPFEDETFEAVLCIDSLNHFRDRRGVLSEWWRVLKLGGRALFTDPVVITGAVSNDELAARSSIGFFLFAPLEVTKHFIHEAGFKLVHCEDVTRTMELTSERRYAARARYREALIQIEGEERFEKSQRFAAIVHQLSSERRLSRFVFVAEK